MRNSWLIVVALAAASLASAAEPRLKYAMIVTRHGVRSPTWDAARLKEYSAAPWPDWGVPEGDLTPHGRAAMVLMGAYYRAWLTSEHLLEPKGCGTKVTVYADKDQRTIETGKALAETLMPGCGTKTGFQPGDDPDPLFSGTFTPDPSLSQKAVHDRLDPDLLAHHKAAIAALEFILGPAPKKPVESAVSDAKGPFATASTLSEDLLLEYTNGMKNPGWGRLTKENLFQVLELHAVYADLMRRTPYLAQRGRNLYEHIRHSMEQAATGRPVEGAIGNPGDAVLVISGHDTNLSNLSGLLGLTWKLPGYQPDDAPPGGALIFTLWQDANGEQTIRLRFVAQSPDQMRTLEPTAPENQELTIPGCTPCRALPAK